MKKFILLGIIFLLFGCIGVEDVQKQDLENETQIEIPEEVPEENLNEEIENEFEEINEEELLFEGIEAILNSRNTLNYRAKYTTSVLELGEISLTEAVVYSKSDHYRIDSVFGEERTIISLFITPKGSYSCIDAVGNVICNDIKISANPNVLFMDLDEYTITEIPGRIVSGEEGICFLFSNEEERFEQCFLENGVSLYLHISSPSSEITQTLKEIDYNVVEDSIFILPA